jgi:hypothetical protein
MGTGFPKKTCANARARASLVNASSTLHRRAA